MVPVTHYAKSGDVHIAYQEYGAGSVDLIWVPGFVSNIDNYWDQPRFANWIRRLGQSARVIMFDKRGTGLSDRTEQLPGLDERMDDVCAVMSAVGLEKAALLGISEGGTLATLFAGTHPEKCTGLVLYGAFAKFRHWFPTPEKLAGFFDYVDREWGSGASYVNYAPSRGNDPAFQEWWGRFERLGASPGAVKELMRMNSELDITNILSSVKVPTLVIHRTEDVLVSVEGGRQLSNGIPGARLVELPGTDHLAWVADDSDYIADLIVEFLTGTKPELSGDRVLATILFTDIVDSTVRAEALGDARWSDLLEAHNQAVRQELERFRGHEIKSLGDGFLATFDGPARAIKCGRAIVDAMRPLGLETRVGVHTGEVEIREGDILGIAVHIASRIVELAQAGETLVSRTVKDLVAGSGITFEDFGIHELKGAPDTWQLFKVKE